MKLYKLSIALIMGIAALASCNDKLEVTNPNVPTSGSFGQSTDELEEVVIAAYNHLRLDGSFSRVAYTIDVCRGDEAWTCSQNWYLGFDNLNVSSSYDVEQWPWREFFYTINSCNFIMKICNDQKYVDGTNTVMDRIKGQALFLRALSYYTLANYYQNPPLVLDYDATYTSLDKMYVSNVPDPATDASGNTIYQYDIVLDQIEADLQEAMKLLPTRDTGGEWSGGRATSGAAAGYYARTLMQRHKYSEALNVLKDILATKDGGNQKYGYYRLMSNFGDNFREGTAYENNEESLFEIQFLDKDNQGVDDEWTPGNTSKNATQGNAVESNFAPGDKAGWADIAVSPWLYNLYKKETTTAGGLDPRLYWTCGTYESQWASKPNGTLGNVMYTSTMTQQQQVNNIHGGIPISKWTHFRTGEYEKVVTGLHSGINLRLMRYSDVLLRAAECANELNDRTSAIYWINKVRNRANLASLEISDYTTQDKLFEQIANVERPKEFGCEYGRCNDLIRWGFFYSQDRLDQLKDHGTVLSKYDEDDASRYTKLLTYYTHDKMATTSDLISAFDSYIEGHEFLPIPLSALNDDQNLEGNSANSATIEKAKDRVNYWKYFQSKGWTIHPLP